MAQEDFCLVPDNPFVVVFDCESDCSLKTCPGGTKEEKLSRYMHFTVCCALTMPSDAILHKADADEIMHLSKRHHYWRDQAEPGTTPIDGMLALFDAADVIVGYNCFDFDFPLLRRFYRSVRAGETATQRYMNHRSKCFDIMAKVRDVTGCYFKLDDLLKLNNLSCKTSNGLKAIEMWESQQRTELKEYCEADVDLTARLALVDRISIDNLKNATCPTVGLRSDLCKKHALKKRDREGEDFVIV